MEECVRTLDAAAIKHVGFGRNIAESHAPAILQRKGTSVAFLNYTSIFTPGYEAAESRPGLSVVRVSTAYALPARSIELPGAPADLTMTPDPDHLARLEKDVRAAREQANVVIVMWHWGVSGRQTGSFHYQHLSAYQVDLAHRAIDLGVDVVAGAGPHVLQGVEIYRSKPIFYSLGECGFDLESLYGETRVQGALLELEIRGGRVEWVALLPLKDQRDGTFALARGEDANEMYYEIKRLCDPFSTLLRRDGDRVFVEIGNTA
jgi:poly-gamma-glutamate synthesis protein (capsule biosynthesis protein)